MVKLLGDKDKYVQISKTYLDNYLQASVAQEKNKAIIEKQIADGKKALKNPKLLQALAA
jgi:hypothetical protein